MRQFQTYLPLREKTLPRIPLLPLKSYVLKKQSFVTMFLETKLYCHWCLYHMVLEKTETKPVWILNMERPIYPLRKDGL